MNASAAATWLEWSAKHPFEPSWWQVDIKTPAMALHYWRIGQALPAYEEACVVLRTACLDVARQWHGAADTLKARAQLTELMDRELHSSTDPYRNRSRQQLRAWFRRLSEKAVDSQRIDPHLLAEALRSKGEINAVSMYQP